MTNIQAAALFAKYDAAVIEELFRNGPKAELVVPEYRHGWIGGFNREMAIGEKYDANQGGWAWV